MDTFDDALLAQYRRAFVWPEIDAGAFVNDGALALVRLAPDVFAYSREVGYAFETAVMRHQAGDRCLLFIRIDSFDPGYRKHNPVDYAIPLAYDGASEAERLRWTIPFGGYWEDATEQVLLVFDPAWRAFFERAGERIAFANPGGESAALLQLSDRHRPAVEAFVGES